MENTHDHVKKILETLGQPSSHSEINYQIYLKSQLDKVDTRPDVCKNCLTSFSLGQFKIEQIKPSCHRRRQKRQHKIDSLQKSLKSAAATSTGKELRALRRRIEHLQDINNHVMLYKCQICQTSNSIRLWKPKSKPSKQTAKQRPQKFTANSAGGNKTTSTITKKKKNKTAGLIIPTTTSTSAVDESSRQQQQHKNFAITKLLALSLQQQQSTAKSKLNQFLK